MHSKILKLLSSEPVRAYIYTIVTILLGLLVTKGIIDGSVQDYVLSIVVAVLGVGTTETVRSAVSPVKPTESPPTPPAE